jgi:hypothetical protein
MCQGSAKFSASSTCSAESAEKLLKDLRKVAENMEYHVSMNSVEPRGVCN